MPALAIMKQRQRQQLGDMPMISKVVHKRVIKYLHLECLSRWHSGFVFFIPGEGRSHGSAPGSGSHPRAAAGSPPAAPRWGRTHGAPPSAPYDPSFSLSPSCQSCARPGAPRQPEGERERERGKNRSSKLNKKAAVMRKQAATGQMMSFLFNHTVQQGRLSLIKASRGQWDLKIRAAETVREETSSWLCCTVITSLCLGWMSRMSLLVVDQWNVRYGTALPKEKGV